MNHDIEREPKAAQLAAEIGQPALGRVLDGLDRIHHNLSLRLVEVDDLRTYVREAIRLRAEEKR